METRSSEEIASDEREFKQYDLRIKGLLGEGDIDYLVEPKVEGVTVELNYSGGALVKAVTSGDDSEGEDVTAKIKTILSVPLTLHAPKSGHLPPEELLVQGEVYMEREGFESLNRSRIQRDLPPFPAQEKAVSAVLMEHNQKAAARSPINIFCRGTARLRTQAHETQYELAITLQRWGFRISRPWLKVCRSVEEVLERCRYLKSVEPSLPYDLEGALIEVNRVDLRRRLEPVKMGRMEGFLFRFDYPADGCPKRNV